MLHSIKLKLGKACIDDIRLLIPEQAIGTFIWELIRGVQAITLGYFEEDDLKDNIVDEIITQAKMDSYLNGEGHHLETFNHCVQTGLAEQSHNQVVDFASSNIMEVFPEYDAGCEQEDHISEDLRESMILTDQMVAESYERALCICLQNEETIDHCMCVDINYSANFTWFLHPASGFIQVVF